MREVHLDEIRRLKPGLRLGFLSGTRHYRDQEVSGVRVDSDHVVSMLKSGQVKHYGGVTASSYDPHIFNNDRIHVPHQAAP